MQSIGIVDYVVLYCACMLIWIRNGSNGKMCACYFSSFQSSSEHDILPLLHQSRVAAIYFDVST